MKMSRQTEISSETGSRVMAGTGLEFECSRDLGSHGDGVRHHKGFVANHAQGRFVL